MRRYGFHFIAPICSAVLDVVFWLVVAKIVTIAQAQIAFDVPCPKVNVVQNFDIQRVWFVALKPYK